MTLSLENNEDLKKILHKNLHTLCLKHMWGFVNMTCSILFYHNLAILFFIFHGHTQLWIIP